jgi:esterase FrsA
MDEEKWALEFIKAGEKCHNKARSPANSIEEKAILYKKAAIYHGIARFPVIDTPIRKKAYESQKKALLEAIKHGQYKFEKTSIPFGNNNIQGYFYSPLQEKEIILPEAVLLSGGLEMLKEDMHHIAEIIVRDCGMACMAIDMPGTGDSGHRLSKECGGIYARAIKSLASRGDIDPQRIGIFGIGFGGYWALATAAKCPEIKAVATCASPVHKTFEIGHLSSLPDFLKRSIKNAMGYDMIDKALQSLSGFSLFKNIDTKLIECPVLSINGSMDRCVTIDDLFLISSMGKISQDEWVFKEDGHYAPRNYAEWVPKAMAWLANKIGGSDRISEPYAVSLKK